METITDRFAVVVEDHCSEGVEMYMYSVVDMKTPEIAIPCLTDVSDALTTAAALNYYARED